MCLLANALLTEDDKREIIELHNFMRRKFAKGSHGTTVANMGKLSWSSDLEQQATERIQCDRLTSNQFDLELKSNIRLNSNGSVTGDIVYWFNEMTNFLLPFRICHPYASCLHAYTLLNAKHRTIGCAYQASCPDRPNTFLCLYHGGSPSPSFYKSGPLCTKCDNPTPFCEDGLCVSCDTQTQQCECRKSCNQPGIGRGSVNHTTCSCECEFGMGPNCDEPCVNPQMYEDYDLCETVTKSECEDPVNEEMFKQYCPETCFFCRRYPTTSVDDIAL